MKKAFRILGKTILIIVVGVLFLIGLLLVVIRLNSTETPTPILSDDGEELPNSIAIIKDTVINGAAQRLTIRGADKSNPVLLRVHGGPGMPDDVETFSYHNIDLEELFTVCYWDQRGGGPAYTADLPASTINTAQIVKDGLDVTAYLKKALGKDKIYIEGISWGTVVAVRMVKEEPENFEAYIGIGQVTDNLENENLVYKYVMNEAKSRNDTLAIRMLTEIGTPPYASNEDAIYALATTRRFVVKYEPVPIKKPGFIEKVNHTFLNDNWSFGYKLHLIQNGRYGVATPILLSENIELNLFEEIKSLSVPVYLIQGDNDHMAETPLVSVFYDSLDAPKKELFIVENAGHSLRFQRPEIYRDIYINEILAE